MLDMNILQQYRQYRQRPTVQGLYPIAESLGLLCYPEPQTGTIGDVRFGAINLKLDRELGYPEKTLKAELYGEFSDIGVLTQLRHLSFQEIHIELFLETLSRSWFQNLSINDSILKGCETLEIDQFTLYTCQPGGTASPIDSIGNAFAQAITRMIAECFDRFDEQEAV